MLLHPVDDVPLGAGQVEAVARYFDTVAFEGVSLAVEGVGDAFLALDDLSGLRVDEGQASPPGSSRCCHQCALHLEGSR